MSSAGSVFEAEGAEAVTALKWNGSLLMALRAGRQERLEQRDRVWRQRGRDHKSEVVGLCGPDLTVRWGDAS